MNEIEAIKWQLDTYHVMLAQQMDRLYNALEELQRTTLLHIKLDCPTDDDIDKWLQTEGFAVDDDGAIANNPAGAFIHKLSMAFYPLDMQPI